ncbi:MAG: geranylgeranylglyceryl/heptaprenylglyceryl phosphate synthase [Bacteroidetes bacterium]|nr:geranylgeranylglyceryl/heptaprenylglyceryl phosphate synthase [Bacteroidota bacterium]
MPSIYTKIHVAKKKQQPQLAVLIDPDKFNLQLIHLANQCRVSYFFVGGSTLAKGAVHQVVSTIKKHSNIPIIIFPGDETQLSAKAEAVLFLSLLSGRNPEYLIGKQVQAAPLIKKIKLESIATAYILVEGKNTSATQKVTGTHPLKNTKEIVHTALAAEMLGFKTVYLEAGSGARKSVSTSIIKQVKKVLNIPLIVGGGIDSAAKAQQLISAGADIVVVGNALEKNPFLLPEIASLFNRKK